MGWSSAGGHRGTLTSWRSPRCTLYLWGQRQSIGETGIPRTGTLGEPLPCTDQTTETQQRISLESGLVSSCTFRARCQSHPLCDIFPWWGQTLPWSQTALGFIQIGLCHLLSGRVWLTDLVTYKLSFHACQMGQ